MLNVIILILKIIGIAIAAILGLVLFVLLLVLFVPIRYRVKAAKDSKIQAEGKVSWLFGIILFKIKYTGNKTKYALRICGYKLLSDEPKKGKKKAVKAKKVRKVPKVSDKMLPKVDKDGQKRPVLQERLEASSKRLPVEIEEVSKEEAPNENKAAKKKRSLRDRIQSFFDKIKSIKRKIRDMLIMIKGIFRKINLVKAFLFDYKNRPGFRVLYKEFKRLIKHIMPTKLRAKVHFGMEDPCYTGQILGAICAVYPEVLLKVNLIPDFNQEVLEGDVEAKGRIRTVTLLGIILRVVVNKKCKMVWNEWKRLKEEL